MSKQFVVEVHRSPLNPLRWCSGLACGHDVWVTSKTPPKRKIVECTKAMCAAQKEG